MRVYGSKISYFTGKLEVYLRYKGISYERLPLHKYQKLIRAHLGTTQMPAVELDDGRWMSDSTPIILHLEDECTDASILPTDPVLRFLAFLIEDYADEWLWRAAMHFRWSYRHDREFAASLLTDELLGDVPVPRFLKRRMITWRQRRGFVIGDGVSQQTRSHVELGYLRALANMSRMLAYRPYLFGDSPSIADIGLMGPMLRHFGQDPTPAELMREQAPIVYEWVGRLWNARASTDAPRWIETSTLRADGMLREACETHLRQLAVNAVAFDAGLRRFDAEIQGCAYRSLPVSRYRVWCLERLRQRFADLLDEDQTRVRSLLTMPEAEVLWTNDFSTRSSYDEKNEAPFNRAINVYSKGVPR